MGKWKVEVEVTKLYVIEVDAVDEDGAQAAGLAAGNGDISRLEKPVDDSVRCLVLEDRTGRFAAIVELLPDRRRFCFERKLQVECGSAIGFSTREIDLVREVIEQQVRIAYVQRDAGNPRRCFMIAHDDDEWRAFWQDVDRDASVLMEIEKKISERVERANFVAAKACR